ncbi:unnamed protein product, partial [Polarella glacialis]
HEGPAAVNLGKAGTYAILSKAGISTVPTSAITGNMGVSPIASTAITGFTLVADSTNTFATSTQVTGSVYGPDYASPTPSDLTVTIGDMEIAYTDAAGRHTPNFLNLGSGDLGGKTLAPGLYKFGSSVSIPADCTIEGSLLSGETDTWIFQMSGDLIMAANKQVTLARGAKASNIVWQVAGYVEVEAGAHMEGILLVKTAAHFRTGSSLTGRILAQTAVTIQSSTVKSRILCPIILLLSLCLAPAAATGTGSGSSADAARCNNGQQAASYRQQDATTETVDVDAACMLQVVSEGLSGADGSAGKRVLSQDEQESLKNKTHEGPAAVNLGKAGTYAILSKAGISTVPTSAITGNMGVSPIDSTAITGFSLVADSTNTFATSTQVTGSVYGPDYASPTPSDLTVTIGDMEIASTDAAGRHTPNFLNLGSGNLGGKTLVPGLYKFGSSVIIPADCTIEGSLLSGETDTWIFQMSGDLIMAANKQVTLARGAKASNIVWQVAGYVEVEAGAHMEGILLVKTAAHFRTGSSLTGRILAQTA